MMQNSKISFWCSKFPWGRERISPKIIDNLSTLSQTFVKPGLEYEETVFGCLHT